MNEHYTGVQGDSNVWSPFSSLSEAEMRIGMSGKVTRTPWSDFLERYGSLSIHEAELFHCNSRISIASQVNAPLSSDHIRDIRAWMDRESYVPKECTLDEHAGERIGAVRAEADEGIQCLMADAGIRSALAVELYLWAGGMLYRMRNRSLWLERRLSSDDAARMADQLHLDQPGWNREVRYLILYAGYPWRYMALQGPRGYRRMLIELGQNISRVEGLLQTAGFTAATSLDFYDDTAELLLGFDGIETTLLATTAASGPDVTADGSD